MADATNPSEEPVGHLQDPLDDVPDAEPIAPRATPEPSVPPAAARARPVKQPSKPGILDILSPGEQLLGIGGGLLVIVDLVGDIILDDYQFSRVLWFFGVVAVIAIYIHRIRGADIFLPYRWTALIAGYGAGLLGLREFLSDIDNSLFDSGGATIFFAVVTWVAAWLMGYGAYRLSGDEEV